MCTLLYTNVRICLQCLTYSSFGFYNGQYVMLTFTKSSLYSKISCKNTLFQKSFKVFSNTICIYRSTSRCVCSLIYICVYIIYIFFFASLICCFYLFMLAEDLIKSVLWILPLQYISMQCLHSVHCNVT